MSFLALEHWRFVVWLFMCVGVMFCRHASATNEPSAELA